MRVSIETMILAISMAKVESGELPISRDIAAKIKQHWAAFPADQNGHTLDFPPDNNLIPHLEALKTARTVSIKAGRYYVVDPGYLFDDDAWDTFGKPLNWNTTGEHRHPCGLTMHIFETMEGDGWFDVEDGGSFGVDTGTFAIVDADQADKLLPEKIKEHRGLIAEVQADGKPVVEICKGIIGGGLYINTPGIGAMLLARESGDVPVN